MLRRSASASRPPRCACWNPSLLPTRQLQPSGGRSSPQLLLKLKQMASKSAVDLGRGAWAMWWDPMRAGEATAARPGRIVEETGRRRRRRRRRRTR
eukprot:2621934-Pyramimonas_sp.AAC.1